MIILKSENFSLSTMTAADVTDEYISWLNDKKINQFLEVRHKVPTREEGIAFVQKFDQKSSFMFAIRENINQKMIGTITLSVDLYNKTASYGYLIGDCNFWGSKAAVEAISLLLNFAFDEIKLRKVTGGAYLGNIGSIFNFKKMGFVQEGRLRAAGVIDEKEVDILLFGILKSEWLERKNRTGI